MTRRFAERFARYLTKGDVRRLFADVLLKAYGSIVRACEAAGIERRTFYNWERVRDVSLETKAKVLGAAFEVDPLLTLLFVARVMRRRAGEALFALVDYVRSEAVRCEDRERFLELAEFLGRALRELGGPLEEEIAVEVSDAKRALELKAAELGVAPSRLWPEDYARWWSAALKLVEVEVGPSLTSVSVSLLSGARLPEQEVGEAELPLVYARR